MTYLAPIGRGELRALRLRRAIGAGLLLPAILLGVLGPAKGPILATKAAAAPSYQTPALVQSALNTGNEVSTTNVAWPGATTVGNTLIAIITAYNSAAGQPAITTPSGWTKIGPDITGVQSSNKVSTAMFYIPNSASRSGNETCAATDCHRIVAAIFEYSGIAAASPIDKTNSSSTAGTPTLSGTTAATTQTAELWFANLSSNRSINNDPTNSFTSVQAGGVAGANLRACHRIVVTTGTAGTQATYTDLGNDVSVGMITTFKAALAP